MSDSENDRLKPPAPTQDDWDDAIRHLNAKENGKLLSGFSGTAELSTLGYDPGSEDRYFTQHTRRSILFQPIAMSGDKLAVGKEEPIKKLDGAESFNPPDPFQNRREVLARYCEENLQQRQRLKKERRDRTNGALKRPSFDPVHRLKPIPGED